MTCVKHSGFVLMVMVAVSMFVASVGFAGAAAEAPIGGTGLLPGESPTPGTANHSLKMHSPPGAVSVHPESGESVQGGVYVINPTSGCVSVPQIDPGAIVATAVAIPATNIEIVILVEGVFCDETAGGGGGESSWDVRYNRDTPKILLEINTDASSDDLVGHGVTWTTLKLTLVAGEAGKSYQATLSSTGGAGNVTVTAPPALTTTNPVQTTMIRGDTLGAVTLGGTCTNDAVIVSISGEVVKPITSPHGNPASNTASAEGYNSSNEVVFEDVQYCGQLTAAATVVCEAALICVDPASFEWEISGSGFGWDTGSSGPGSSPGTGQVSNAIDYGLPADNDDFGEQTVTLEHAVHTGYSEASAELFFPKNETNHPSDATNANWPNWFFYWRQVYGDENVVYNGGLGANVGGKVPAMMDWDYAINHNNQKQRIEIGDLASKTYRDKGVGKVLTGIDRYVATTKHEEVHIDQVQGADQLVPVAQNTVFRYGWSWNQVSHNHWSKGTDGVWGNAANPKANFNGDDDGNGVVDDAKGAKNPAGQFTYAPTFEPGWALSDDVRLSRANTGRWSDWPNAKANPNPDLCYYPEESEALNTAEAAVAEHDNAGNDWGKPGKNHKTLNIWND